MDWVNTGNLTVKNIIAPRRDAFEYLSDGRGTVRIMGTVEESTSGYASGRFSYFYRPVGSADWHKLSVYDERDRSGFEPLAVDPSLNVAYGFRRDNGHRCLYSIKLDDSLEEHLILRSG